MSAQSTLPGFEGLGSVNGSPAEAIRASIAREMRYLLTISRDASKPFAVRPAGVAHSLGVCLLEDWNMARGKGKQLTGAAAGNLPRFVDVKLSTEDREAFVAWLNDPHDAVRCMQVFADTGYRVGVSWSGEHQTYTVSVTCRDEASPNNGLCMTSFSRDLEKAVLLAWFKHEIVCEFVWSAYDPDTAELFG